MIRTKVNTEGGNVEKYPLGTRLMLAVSKRTGIGPHQLCGWSLFRWVIIVLDSLCGKPPIWPK